jgi:hypothetical protein
MYKIFEGTRLLYERFDRKHREASDKPLPNAKQPARRCPHSAQVSRREEQTIRVRTERQA